MKHDTASAGDFGRSLTGIGLNLLVRNVATQVAFPQQVFGMQAHQAAGDFAIMILGRDVFQLHSDATYHSSPLSSLLPETCPRGAGVEIRLYDVDPEIAVARAENVGAHVLQAPTDKPHVLRKAYILCENMYAWRDCGSGRGDRVTRGFAPLRRWRIHPRVLRKKRSGFWVCWVKFGSAACFGHDLSVLVSVDAVRAG